MRRIPLAAIGSLLFFLEVMGMLSPCVATNSWVSKTGMTYGRSGLGVATADGKIYAIGGASANGFCSFNEQYDPSTNTWTSKASMPTARSAFGIAVFQNRIYCIGGYVKWGPTAVNEVYNPASDSWQTKKPLPAPSLNIQANVVEGKIYVIGGNPNGTLNQVYDPITDSWATKAPVPTAVSSPVSAVADDKIYVFANGLTQIYDAKNDSWSVGTPAPSPIITAAAAATTGIYAAERIFVFGAEAKLPYWQLTTTGFITQGYNPETDNWTQSFPMPTGRYDVGVGVVDDIIYTIGGFTTQLRNDGAYFNPNPIIVYRVENQQYSPLGYGTVPPKISIVSPTNTTYTTDNISLAYTTNKPASWQGYNLDRQKTATIVGNTTISNLSSGAHSLTIYATDLSGNNGSQTIVFNISLPSVPLSNAVVINLGAAAAVICVCALVLVYLKKRKKDT